MMRRRLAIVLALVAAAPFASLARAQIPIRLEVVDERGSPIAGATVAVGEPGAEPTPIGSTGPDGSFAGTLTPQQVNAGIYVSAPGRGGAASDPALMVLARASSLPVVLGRGVALVGRVRDASGRPVAAAEVVATELRIPPSALFGWHGWTRTTTDERGIFRLQGVPESNQRLEVTAPGHLSVAIAPVALGTPLEVTLPSGGLLRGTVVDEKGAPVAADLEVEYENAFDVQRVRAGADGRFELTWRHPCFCRVCASVGEPPSAIAYSDVLESVPADLRLVLRPVAELPLLRVRATGDGGAPLAAFRAVVVWWTGAPEDVLWRVFPFEHRPARDGLCCLAAPEPDTTQKGGLLMVVAPGRASTIAEVEWKPGADGATEITVATAPARTQRGIIVDAAGKPVAGESVWVRRIGGDVPHGVLSLPPLDAVRTGADGAFALDGLGAGHWNVFFTTAGATRMRGVQVRADADPEPLRLQLPEFANALGHALGVESGWRLGLVPPGLDPAAGRLFGGPYTVGDAPLEATSAFAADGGFAIDRVQVGTHRFVLLVPRPIHRDGWLCIEQRPVRVAAGNNDGLVVDTKSDRPAILRGRVVMTGAQVPPERLLVEIMPAKTALQMPELARETYGWCRGDAVRRDGSFELWVAPGKHRLRVRDTLSGIVLAQTDEPIEADGDATATPMLSLTVEAAELQVEFASTEAGANGPGAHLDYRKAGSFNGPESWANRFWGIRLGDTPSSTVLYVPAGAGVLSVVTSTLPRVNLLAARQLSPWRSPSDEHEGADVVFDADPKKPTAVRVEVPRRRLFP
jgi:hypothetical protein